MLLTGPLEPTNEAYAIAKIAGIAMCQAYGRQYFLLRHQERPDIINVGVGEDVSIAELAELVRSVVGYPGDIVYDTTKPGGTPWAATGRPVWTIVGRFHHSSGLGGP